MSHAETNELGVIWERVNIWTPAQKIALMHRILDSLEAANPRAISAGGSDRGPEAPDAPAQAEMRQAEFLGTRGTPRKTLADFLGLFQTDATPPTDEEVERILEEERMRKYG